MRGLADALAVGAGRVRLSAADGFLADRAAGFGRDEVLSAGRFLLSGMRLRIITSDSRSDQLDQSTLFTLTLRHIHDRVEDSKNRRVEVALRVRRRRPANATGRPFVNERTE
jgi:hypothetical protein